MSDTGDLQPLITQCPNCRTQFRVNEAQLQIAGGKVRCGACLTVFQGVDALVWEDGAETPADSAAENPTDVLDDLLDELDGDPIGAELTAEERSRLEAEESAAAPATASEADTPSETVDQPAGPAPAKPADSEPLLPEGVSAKAALAALRRAAPPASGKKLPPAEPPPAEPLEEHVPSGELDDIELVDEVLTDSVPHDGRVGLKQEREVVEDGSSEVGGDLAAAVAAGFGAEGVQSSEPAKVRKPKPTAEPEPASPPVEEIEAAPAPDPGVPAATAQAASRARGEDSTAVTDADAAVPEDDPFARLSANNREVPLPEPGAQRGWLLYALAGGGVLLLVAQVLVFQFDSWSQNPSTRGIYTALCPVVGCEVPPLKALDRMESRNLSVRSHPDLPEALTVDTVIVNNADFPQTFPIIELTFTDIDGKVVAGRRFEPSEYLAGELKGARNIASRTPVRIRLEIRDPGPTAVSYKMDFR